MSLLLVALRTEGVDRNKFTVPNSALVNVALRTEGVDRNEILGNAMSVFNVALRTEGVDRNLLWRLWMLPVESRRPPYGGRG